jgi:hypothetical protein
VQRQKAPVEVVLSRPANTKERAYRRHEKLFTAVMPRVAGAAMRDRGKRGKFLYIFYRANFPRYLINFSRPNFDITAGKGSRTTARQRIKCRGTSLRRQGAM